MQNWTIDHSTRPPTLRPKSAEAKSQAPAAKVPLATKAALAAMVRNAQATLKDPAKLAAFQRRIDAQTRQPAAPVVPAATLRSFHFHAEKTSLLTGSVMVTSSGVLTTRMAPSDPKFFAAVLKAVEGRTAPDSVGNLTIKSLTLLTP
jgi:hypothetical protein